MEYTGTLLGALAIFLLGGSGFSLYLLVLVLLLPGCSLAVSLPAMAVFRLKPQGPRLLRQGQTGKLYLSGRCRLPMPPFSGGLRLWDCMANTGFRYDPAQGIPTVHCGGYRVEITRGRVWDYLGLVWLPRGRRAGQYLWVMPKPVEPEILPDLENPRIVQWADGIVSPEEIYALKPYRTGDSPKNLHWKVSMKLGNPILRKPQEPKRGLLTVQLVLRGSRGDLDEKLGKLYWVGNYLLSHGVCAQLQVLTGKGVQLQLVRDEATLQQAMEALLCCPGAEPGEELGESGALWCYCIR